MQSSAMRGVNTPDEVPLLSWARWCSKGRPLIHDGRIACSCRQQATKCVSEAACCFYRLPEAAFCRGKQQPAPETNFEICVPPAAAATILASCRQLQPPYPPDDLSSRTQKVTSECMPWHVVTESARKNQLNVLHRAGFA